MLPKKRRRMDITGTRQKPALKIVKAIEYQKPSIAEGFVSQREPIAVP